MPIFPSFFVNKDAAAYQIEQSLRFDGSSGYLSRTPGSAGNLRTWTFSVWLKRSKLTQVGIFCPVTGGDGSNESQMRIKTDNTFQVYDSGAAVMNRSSTQLFRDPSAWFHLVVAVDTTQATDTNRVKIYVNGSQIEASGLLPGQNNDLGWNGTSRHDIGRYAAGAEDYFDGYMAEMHHIDGTQLDPTDFGEYDNNGVWRPIEYTGGSYGTNGFYLKFDETATNGIGHDHSGNGNNFTASGFTISGIGTDVMSDTPTTNFPTLNPLDNLNGRYSNDPTNGNLEVSIPSDSVSKRNFPGFYSTQSIPTTGKFYFEFEPSQQYTDISIVDVNEVGTISSGDHIGASDKLSFKYAVSSGDYRFNGSTTASGLGGFSANNIYGVAVDLENETFRVYENGIAGSELSVSGYLGADARIAPSVSASGSSGTVKMNFGQREFANPPGTVGATEYFNTVLYTGNGSTQSVTGVGFQPDLVIAKNRDSVNGWRVYDSVRGVGIQLQLDSQNQEETVSSGLTSFDSDGFSLGSSGGINGNGINFAAWCWKAGGTASSNTDGSITSSVSANNDAGFSVVTYSGSTADGTVGHGLNAAPDVIIFKRRNNTTSWPVYTSMLGASKSIYINETGGEQSSGQQFGSTPTAPTNSVFSVGNAGDTNYGNMLAYCFTEKTGVSKFGTYEGNGSSDGPVISCGFRPAMVMIKWYKDVNSAESWQLYDNKRAGNPTNTILQPDSAGAEESPSDRYIQFTADGFQLKSSGQQINRSGAKYIFMAWAATFTGDENFKALNTKHLPAPTVKDGSDYFNTLLWSGDGASSRALTGVGFQPEMTWIKARNQGYSHQLFDAVRGAGGNSLQPNLTAVEGAEGTGNGYLSSFDSDGFTVDYGTNGFYSNRAGTTYVAWSWDAGGSGSSNTDGSITSTVSANPSAGFSIVGYTGTGSAATVGHGLGVPPAFMILKCRNKAFGWTIYHQSLGNTRHLEFTNSTGYTGDAWNSTNPTSTVFSIGTDAGSNNGSSPPNNYVAYCFAEVEGYSKFGSYTGNGSTDGPFVATSFTPSWVMIKRTDSTSSWSIRDTTRSPYNVVTNRLWADLSNSESTSTTETIDILSNGFKPRNNIAGINTSGGTYIFAAFAENPFGGDGVSPATAR